MTEPAIYVIKSGSIEFKRYRHRVDRRWAIEAHESAVSDGLMWSDVIIQNTYTEIIEELLQIIGYKSL